MDCGSDWVFFSGFSYERMVGGRSTGRERERQRRERKGENAEVLLTVSKALGPSFLSKPKDQ